MQKAKKIWTHEGPSTKEKNEHVKAHVLKEKEKRKKKDSHVLK